VTRSSVVIAGLALVALGAWMPTWAAEGFTSAPVRARLTADASTLARGGNFTVNLQLTALADIPQARLSLSAAQRCAELLPGQAERLEMPLKANESLSRQFRYRLLSDQPCSVIAELVSLQTTDTRLASVFSVTLNARPESLPAGTTRGQTAEGRKTVEAPAAPR